MGKGKRLTKLKSFDKTTHNTSMQDYMSTNMNLKVPIIGANSKPPVEGPSLDSIPLPYNVISEEQVKERELYNSELIFKFNPLYESFTPRDGVLVRVFARAYGKAMGLYQDYAPKIPVYTKAGKGILKYVSDPYPFGMKAVVVSTAPYLDGSVNKGDIVQILPVDTLAPLPGDDTFIVPKHFFIHADTENILNYDTPPKDVSDPEFGYFLIPVSNIIGKLNGSPAMDVPEQTKN